MTLTEKLAEIRARLEKATAKGRGWFAFFDFGDTPLGIGIKKRPDGFIKFDVCNVADALFIASAPTDLSLLLKVCEIQGEALDKIRRERKSFGVCPGDAKRAQEAVDTLLKGSE